MKYLLNKPFNKYRLFPALVLIFSFFSLNIFAQSACPVNIGFEQGDFMNWECSIGSVGTSNGQNVISLSPTSPMGGQHAIIPRGNLKDPYGNFPISAPDGSAYSVKLGNNSSGSGAERVTYTFTVPLNQADFVLTYQYAVVLQDPGHSAAEQPRFTAKVFDMTDGIYVSCGSFDYIATAALPGFKTTGISQVVYKEWTPASINLYGYQGHKLRLEFTTADCTVGGHFGYAYIDVNSNCSSLITGANYCESASTYTLAGPSGFSKYTWYNADRSKILGTTQYLSGSTVGADGKTFVLDIVPFVGFGCNYTTTVKLKGQPAITFNINHPLPVCGPATIDITADAITATSDKNLTYTYWKDPGALISVPSPKHIDTAGTYYIKATAPSGCEEIKPVNVIIYPQPFLIITNPATVCEQTPVDITKPGITVNSTFYNTLTYWTDSAATQPLADPKNINTAGTYYIKATNLNQCTSIKPVVVSFYKLPVLVINNPAPVCFPLTVDITAPAVTIGSDYGLRFSYWQDAAATIPLINPSAVQITGTYYIKAINTSGCETIKPVVTTNHPLPVLVINNPPDLCWPERADITQQAVTAGSTGYVKLSYWQDANATIALTKPTALTDSGDYYIKAENALGCSVMSKVVVTIHNLPVVEVTDPKKAYAPNTVDLTLGEVVRGSSAKLTYTYWKDAAATISVNDASRVDRTGTYYIRGENIYGCYVIKPVKVVVDFVPQILVPKAFTPMQATNNKLYPFLLGIKTLKYFKVYNRWGNLIFQTNSAAPENGWDGTYRGSMQFMETFTWYAEGIDYLDKPIHRSGNTIMLK